MKKSLLFLCLIISGIAPAQQTYIDQALWNKLETAAPNDALPVFVRLDAQVDLTQFNDLPLEEKRRRLCSSLQSLSKLSEDQLNNTLAGLNGLVHYRKMWITNGYIVSATPDALLALSNLPEVSGLFLDEPVARLHAPVETSKDLSQKSVGGIEPGLEAIGAPALWAMGYTGRGRMAMSLDTGVLPDHPSFRDRYKGNSFPLAESWFAYDSPVPTDKPSSHGTHTVGTILGLDTATADTIGVAPNAWYIATDPVVSDLTFLKPLSDFMFAFQWALDPDGNPLTTADMPDVINNSWGYTPPMGEPNCPDFVSPVVEVVEAAGIANVFSAGNEGPGNSTIGIPQHISLNEVNCFTVGALNANSSLLEIADFSSRGPGICGGEGEVLIKPEVTAPGVGVRSATAQGYELFSGTSMAAPHVAGAVLLLKEAFPDATGKEILEALYYSATDLGDDGEDNTYGRGLISLPDAFNWLENSYTPTPPLERTLDLQVFASEALPQGLTCASEVPLEFKARNAGTETIATATVYAAFTGGDTLVFNNVSIDLNPGEEAVIETGTVLPLSGNGAHELHIWAVADSETPEWDVFSNHAVVRFTRLGNAPFPFSEDFPAQLSPERWERINPDMGRTWDTASVVGSAGEIGAMRMALQGYTPRQSQRDQLITQRIDIPASSAPGLIFDYAYAQRLASPLYQDTLRVLIYTECPVSGVAEEIWKLGGEELATVEGSVSDFEPTSATEWERVFLELSPWAGESVYVAFESENRSGGNLYLDRVRIGVDVLSITEPDHSEWTIHPNPATSVLYLNAPSAVGTTQARIFDITGKQVADAVLAGSGAHAIDVSELATGIYVIDTSTQRLKFVKR